MVGAATSAGEMLDCELCVVGAGYAALNGLNVAAKYLKKGDRVVFVDKHDTWGGQWTHQYDFVRLHQPYRMFTAGDQPWALRRDPSYLATRREVLDHLASVPSVSAGHLEIKTLFGHAYTGHRVRDGRVEVDVAPASHVNGASAKPAVRARRLLRATGTDIEVLPPLTLSSSRVRSVGVSDPSLLTPEFLASDAPVYVVGSGKTAMDFVRHVVQRGRRRPVHVIAGSGMWFFIRDNLYPGGIRRYARGTLTADVFLRLAETFDGQNETAIVEAFARDGLMMNVFGRGGNCRLGLLSFAERDEIRAGVTEVHRGHLVDVDGTRMVVRNGKVLGETPVADGSWFVNCTSHFRQFPHQPVLSDDGLVCAPQFAMGFSGTSAYYVTHLWYRDELAPIAPKLFRSRVDVEPKLRFLGEVGLMVMANTAMAGARLPLSVPSKFLGDFNKWYPIHRQIPTLARIITRRDKIVRRAEQVLRLRYADPPDPA